MAAPISHTTQAPSIPTTLQEANDRIRQLEAEASRLRCILHGIQNQIAALEPGKYILLDDGDFGGPYSGNIDRIVRDFTHEGTPCTVIDVVARYDADMEPEDFGVTAGIDYPCSLSPAVGW